MGNERERDECVVGTKERVNSLSSPRLSTPLHPIISGDWEIMDGVE